MRIAPRVFWPLIPLMVINLEPVRQEGILHISTNCVLESPFPSFLPKGLPNPSLSPSPFSFTFPLREHTPSTLGGIHITPCISAILVGLRRISAWRSLSQKMNPRLCVGAVRGGSGPWRRGQRGSCQWVLAVAGG